MKLSVSLMDNSLKLYSHYSATDTPDIIFAYADIMQMKLPNNEMKIFSANKMLQADIMYDQIVQTVNKTEKRLTIKRVPLNYIELQKILT